MSVRSEQRRLRAAFRAALLAGAAATGGVFAFACSAPSPGVGAGSGGHTASGAGGGHETSASSSATGDPDPCAPVPFHYDAGDDAGDCVRYVHLPCGIPAEIRRETDCFLFVSDCPTACGTLAFNCHVIGTACVDGGIEDDAGQVIDLDCSLCAGSVGRAPPGLRRAAAPFRGSAPAVHLAQTAELEAASVDAFRLLGRELARHGAPRALVAGSVRARRDEERHARLTAAMCRRFGGSPRRARVAPSTPRPLEDVAVENAVEGCVRETFGALVAAWQAAHASDGRVAEALGSIARDEARHAALSWALARWASSRLEPASRARALRAGRRAIASLRRAACAPVDPALVERLGLPDGPAQRAMIASLERDLWAGLSAQASARRPSSSSEMSKSA